MLDRDLIAVAGDPWRIHVFRETTSTNDLALRAAEGGEAEGCVFFAESQTGGRGQFGRRWASAPGLGLWFSLLLRPRWPAAELAQMTPVIAVAVTRALETTTGLTLRIKRPNDVYCGGRKLAGILSEARTGRDVFVVVGIGINVNHAAADFPLELHSTATSLALAAGRPWAREPLAAAVLRAISEHYSPGAPPDAAVLAAYEALASRVGCDTFRA